MNREEFMALESPEKAEELNVFIESGMSQKEAMAQIGVDLRDLMAAQVFFSKSEGKFMAKAVGGYANVHSDTTAEAPK